MKLKPALLLLSVGIAGIAYWLYAWQQPIIYAFHEMGDPTEEPVWTLLNPLRDRTPEHPAEKILQRLQAGDSSGALQMVRGLTAGTIAELGDREWKYRITGWKLVQRIDRPSEVTMTYRVSRNASGEMNSLCWIKVQRIDGAWEPIGYEAWY